MIYITRKEHFCAAHKLHRDEWSAEKNLETFGKCSNPNWHGHNYTLKVTVKGMPDPLTGFVLDLKKLSVLVKEKIIEARIKFEEDCERFTKYVKDVDRETDLARKASEEAVRKRMALVDEIGRAHV